MELFKTVIPAEIKTVTEAKNFLKALYDNGEEYHPEDNANTIVWKNGRPTTEQADQLNKVMVDIESLPNFDPCEYLLFLSERVLVKAKFEIEGYPVVNGYHNPHHLWNGWNRPMFDKETVEVMLNNMSAKWVYNSETDSFLIDGDWSEPEIAEGEIVETEHGPKKLYGLGTGSWTWELAEEN